MTPESWKRVEDLFDEVADLGAGERTERLEGIRKTDPEIYAELKSLIEAHDEADALLGGFENLVSEPDFELLADPVPRLTAALEGRYVLDRVLGEGGMATVYLADDLKHERKVALKVLRPELAAVIGAERFLAEIKTTAKLQHPHILPLHDSGEAEGFLFYVMPYVQGQTLKGRLDRDGQLPVSEAVAIARDMAEALQAAHEQGVIHRDIKPSNVLMSRGKPLIADFGIALALSSAGGGERLTNDGLSLGTPYYMSPEQATGERTVGPATDVWSLGCVLYEMLVGEPPYTGASSQAVLRKIIAGEPISAMEQRLSVPANVDAAVRKALEKLPADRFTSAQDFEKALGDEHFRYGAVAEGNAVATRRRTLWRAALPWGLAAAVATVIVLSSRSPAVGPEAYDWGFPPEAPMSFTGGSYDGVGYPAFSLPPRGDFLVYVAERGDGTELWYRSLVDINDAHSIDGTEGAYFPMVSPDGEWVAFLRDAQLHKVAIGGGRAVPLLDVRPHGESGHWVSMNQILVVDRDATRIRIVDPTTGQITSERRSEACQLPFMLSNEHVLCNHFGPYRARVLHRDSSVTRDLQQGGQRAFGSSLRFVGEGYLTFVTAEGALQIAPLDPETLQLGRPATLVPSVRREGISGAAHYAVTSSGALVYAPGDNAEEGQLVRRARGGALSEALDVDPAKFITFDLSPDGARLAAVRAALDGMELWVYELPGGQSYRWLTSELDDLREPRWSPSGETLAVRSFSEALGRRVIMVGDPSSGPPSDTVDFMAIPTDWVSDDRLLANRRGPSGILDLYSSPSAFVDTVRGAGGTLSPDRRWRAYGSGVSGRNEVYLERFPEGRPRFTLTTNGGQEVVWLSSTELAYRRGRTWYTVLIAGYQPSEPQEWFSDDRFLDTVGRSHAPSRDGGVIYIQGTSQSTASFLRVIPNWLEGATRAADAANRVPN